jgi:hypothetical protein
MSVNIYGICARVSELYVRRYMRKILHRFEENRDYTMETDGFLFIKFLTFILGLPLDNVTCSCEAKIVIDC